MSSKVKLFCTSGWLSSQQEVMLTIVHVSGCGAVGRVVAFKTRGPRFDSSHRQNFIEHLFIINCIEKTKINEKEAGNGPLF